MEDRTIVFADIKGSTNHLSRVPGGISGLLKEIGKLPANTISTKTWGDAYFAVFASAHEAVRHALEVRDGLRFHDWRAVGVTRPPLLRIAIARGAWLIWQRIC